jgi:hypothetical protein
VLMLPHRYWDWVLGSYRDPRKVDAFNDGV